MTSNDTGASSTTGTSSPHRDLHCPDCAEPLTQELQCSACGISYPTLNGVPFLFPTAQLELARWQARAHSEQQNLLDQKKRCKSALQKLDRTARDQSNTVTRLEHLVTAYTEQVDCLSHLLQPLINNQPGSDHTTYRALETPGLADTTTLFSYASNLFRDWAWGEEENQQAIDMLLKVGPQTLGKTLVLGAGGGRLAWDLAVLGAPEVTAVDINPFTSLAAQQITRQVSSDELKLWEFPLAPVSAEDTAVRRLLTAPAVAPSGKLRFILADARALPFAPHSFDTVVTPWFTDVVQDAPAATAQRINQLLVQGGHWLNFGSVAFADANPADCLLLPELLALVEANGFLTPRVIEQRGPYLCSPHSRYGRTELLHAFCAEKTDAAPATPMPSATPTQTPKWLTHPHQPIPALKQFTEQAMITQVHAYLMSLIDGNNSIEQIAQVLEQQRLMSATEAVPVIQGFLKKMLDR